MPKWPHEYLVKERVDQVCFVEMVRHIRTYGYLGKFYQREISYFQDYGFVYWTMGAPVEETTIINRCLEDQTYEARLKNGTLPA